MPEGKSDKEQRIAKVERIIGILFSGDEISREDIHLIHRWLSDAKEGDEKSVVLARKLSEAFRYNADSRYAETMWPQLAQRLGLDPGIIDIPSTETLHTPVERVRIPLHRRAIFKAAAVLMPFLVVATALGLLVYRTGDTGTSSIAGNVTASVAAENRTVIVHDGEPGPGVVAGSVVHILPDNSTVRLAEGSELRHYEGFEGDRRVELKGGARFNVTKARGEDDYFTVHTVYVDIRVLGTDFYVHSPAGTDHSTIDLYHGSVEVRAGGKTVRMKPTDHLRFDHATHEIILTTIPYGTLQYEEMLGMVFSNASMTDVFAKLEKEFGIAVRIEGRLPEVQTRVEGDLSMVKTLDELMRRLQILSGRFDYEIGGSEILITINNI